ncbi:hypothetical protein AcW2_001257 [Taiwanofungus camphoratus]|nr:hypothetical protein AcW2_001257 [Antrodia cinnamomea]
MRRQRRSLPAAYSTLGHAERIPPLKEHSQVINVLTFNGDPLCTYDVVISTTSQIGAKVAALPPRSLLGEGGRICFRNIEGAFRAKIRMERGAVGQIGWTARSSCNQRAS